MFNKKEIIIDSDGYEHEVVDYTIDIPKPKSGLFLYLYTELMMFGTAYLFIAIYIYFFGVDIINQYDSYAQKLVLLTDSIYEGISNV
ncbi:MAG: hypothetical protein COB17_04740 [Sulfurimonas sp.]|nr:MAG: hypothetical protein COB17_04740 [Sulfurimonas sp.]